MQAKELVKNKVNIRFSGREVYLEKKGIIQDKKCKNCKKLILKEKDFCECGFYLKAERVSVFWSSIIFPLVFIVVVWLVGAINFGEVKNLAFEKIKKQKISFNSLSPVNIQMIESLKESPYKDYIQNIYVKQGQKNILLILIKPTFWNLLSKNEKKDLLKFINLNWKTIYKQSYPNSVLKPDIEFANPD